MNIVQRLGSFTIVGTVAFVVDLGGFNLLAYGSGTGLMTAKILSVALATVVSWAGSRYFTFKELGGRTSFHEILLFALTNVVGLGSAAGCLYVSHYLLGFTSVVADNIAGNVIGVLLGNVFRYFSYRYVVFQPTTPIPPALPAAPTACHHFPTVDRVHA